MLRHWTSFRRRQPIHSLYCLSAGLISKKFQFSAKNYGRAVYVKHGWWLQWIDDCKAMSHSSWSYAIILVCRLHWCGPKLEVAEDEAWLMAAMDRLQQWRSLYRCMGFPMWSTAMKAMCLSWQSKLCLPKRGNYILCPALDYRKLKWQAIG